PKPFTRTEQHIVDDRLAGTVSPASQPRKRALRLVDRRLCLDASLELNPAFRADFMLLPEGLIPRERPAQGAAASRRQGEAGAIGLRRNEVVFQKRCISGPAEACDRRFEVIARRPDGNALLCIGG